ncbi:unnamed protein product [Cylindrotheca closterium]|uniref:Selenoprotein T n=1 Tax=Cylindrotheca closterium TaxID=2856 RepID=A0AAD2CRJ1_9STRA|nr:unnamed protein product [Cylindrotheca closterium]
MLFLQKMRVRKASTLFLLCLIMLGMISLSLANEAVETEQKEEMASKVVRQWLYANFPELRGKVTGDNYPPPPTAELLLKILNVIQMCGLLFVFLGDKLFGVVGMSYVPSWYATVQKNGMQIAIFVYLLLPNVLSKYMISGAFEIILDGETIFSKLETGRLPQMGDLVAPLVNAGLTQVSQ